MPKKKQEERLKPYELPHKFPRQLIEPLKLEERNRFRDIINDPVFKRALQNAYVKKPGVAPQGTGAIELNQFSVQIANNRLHQIQGWEMFEAALFMQAEEPVKTTRTPLQETYPDSGVIGNETK